MSQESKYRMKVEMKPLYTDEDIDRDFKKELSREIGAKSLLQCIQCGVCSSGCTVSEYIDLQPHRMVASCLLGLKDLVLISNAIWICSLCHKCTERCPKHVDYSFLLALLRNKAAALGNAPSAYVQVIKNLGDHGLATPPPGKSVIKKREKYNLPEYPKPNTEDVKKLIELNGLGHYLGE